jgi:enterochelin esterase-like enzyme
MLIPNEMLTNRAYDTTSVAYHKQMPGTLSRIPGINGNMTKAITVLPDGTAECKFYAPDAKIVSVGHMLGEQVPMVKGEDGIWSCILTSQFPGFKEVLWLVDGVPVMNPFAQVAFGFGHPLNYYDIPNPEQDYLMLKDVPHGSVVREYFKSSVSGETESCLVYLPACYREQPERRFPVLYLQHGGGENDNCWIHEGKTNFMMDNLLAEGKAVPFIIVMNTGIIQIKGEDGTWSTGSRHLLQELVINDCMPFIDAHYRTIPDAWNRAYAGLSMGSLQGGRFFMQRRDVIASAGLFTGYKEPNHADYSKSVASDYLSAMDDVEGFNKSVRLFFIAVGQNEPSLVKVEQEDKELTEKGIKHVYHSYPGAHEWNVWRAAMHDYAMLLFR